MSFSSSSSVCCPKGCPNRERKVEKLSQEERNRLRWWRRKKELVEYEVLSVEKFSLTSWLSVLRYFFKDVFVSFFLDFSRETKNCVTKTDRQILCWFSLSFPHLFPLSTVKRGGGSSTRLSDQVGQGSNLKIALSPLLSVIRDQLKSL